MVTPGIEVQVGSLFFTSKFDSGNLARVERVNRDEEGERTGFSAVLTSTDIKPDYEYNVWTRPDCYGTPFENANRSWFYFGVRGGSPNRLIKINIMNMNKQGKLYSQGHSPIVKTVPGRPKWERIRDKPTYECVENNFVLSFTHRFLEVRGATTYFAFCYPWSHKEQQEQLEMLDVKYSHCGRQGPHSIPSEVYYHQETLCYSLDQLPVDLLTISDCSGIQRDEEDRFDPKLFPNPDKPRCKKFTNKKVFFVSSRVHPGETPASHVFNGLLQFLLSEDDPRARRLRSLYIVKLIPSLNPDGVMRGHYRTDARGVNLNRMYLDPSFELYPTIYASKALMVYYHVQCRVKAGGAEVRQNSEVSLDSHVLPDRPAEPPGSMQFPVTPNKLDSSPIRDVRVSDRGRTKVSGQSEAVADEWSRFAAVSGQLEGVSLGAELSEGEEEPVRGGARSSLELLSGGECLDDTEHLGNEGSEDGDSPAPTSNAPHLADPALLDIPPDESGVALYVDLHGHASKRGCFIYGNSFESEETQAECMLYPKLISLNTAHFDFAGCNFTERNMYLKDKREGLSKEGSGRVAMWKALGIIRSYTLECNYNTGRIVNSVPPAQGDGGRATPPPVAGFPPKYTPAHYEEVGRAMALAALDLTDSNPWSRLPLSDHCSVSGVRDWLRRYVRSLRGLPRGPSTALRSQKAAARASGLNSSAPVGQSLVPRVAFLTRHHNPPDSAPPSQGPGRSVSLPSQEASRSVGPPRQGPGRSIAPPTQGAGRTVAPPTRKPATNRKELAPIREPPRATLERSRRRTAPVTTAPVTKTTPSSASVSEHMPQLSLVSATDLITPLTLSSPSLAINSSSLQLRSEHPRLAFSELSRDRLVSAASSTASVEEEKVEQLKHIPHLSVGTKAGKVELTRSDPVSRKNKRPWGNKRRASSYSPQGTKLPTALSRRASGPLVAVIGSAADTERKPGKPAARRRKSIVKASKKGAAGGRELTDKAGRVTDNEEEEGDSGMLVKLSPRLESTDNCQPDTQPTEQDSLPMQQDSRHMQDSYSMQLDSRNTQQDSRNIQQDRRRMHQDSRNTHQDNRSIPQDSLSSKQLTHHTVQECCSKPQDGCPTLQDDCSGVQGGCGSQQGGVLEQQDSAPPPALAQMNSRRRKRSKWLKNKVKATIREDQPTPAPSSLIGSNATNERPSSPQLLPTSSDRPQHRRASPAYWIDL